MAFESTLASASSRCSVETNSSFIAVGFGLGRFEHFRQAADQAPGGDPPLDFGKCFSSASTIVSSWPTIGADLLQQRPHDALALVQQRGQQVQRLDLRIASVGGELLRALHGLLGFDRQFVESKCHELMSGVRVSNQWLIKTGNRRAARPAANQLTC